MAHQWVYRPKGKEHEMLMRMIAESPHYTSVAQVVRESVMRFVYENDKRKLYTELSDMIDEFHDTKNKFMSLLLKHSEDL